MRRIGLVAAVAAMSASAAIAGDGTYTLGSWSVTQSTDEFGSRTTMIAKAAATAGPIGDPGADSTVEMAIQCDTSKGLTIEFTPDGFLMNEGPGFAEMKIGSHVEKVPVTAYGSPGTLLVNLPPLLDSPRFRLFGCPGPNH